MQQESRPWPSWALVTYAVTRLWIAGCSGSSAPPTSPTPVPTPTFSRVTVSGTITETLTGSPVGSFSETVDRLPMLLPVSAQGFVTRQAWITSATPSVDLIRESGFDLAFYRQFARGELHGEGLWPLRLLRQSPSIYLQRTGLSDATVATLRSTAAATIPAMTGGRFQLATWETGDAPRSNRDGWITVELIVDEAATCGRATIGDTSGHIWLNIATKCHRNGAIIGTPSVFAHEIGHALGFWHIPIGLMQSPTAPVDPSPTPKERHHGAIAYARSAGNRDIDQDVPGSSTLAPARIISD